MDVDRRAFLATLGGAAAVEVMPHEERADALEHYMMDLIDEQGAQNNQLVVRRGVGLIFSGRGEPTPKDGSSRGKLELFPEKPTLVDFFKLRSRLPPTCCRAPLTR